MDQLLHDVVSIYRMRGRKRIEKFSQSIDDRNTNLLGELGSNGLAGTAPGSERVEDDGGVRGDELLELVEAADAKR